MAVIQVSRFLDFEFNKLLLFCCGAGWTLVHVSLLNFHKYAIFGSKSAERLHLKRILGRDKNTKQSWIQLVLVKYRGETNDSFFIVPAHLGLGAGHKAEGVEQTSQTHLHLQLGHPHPHTVAGSGPEWQVHEGMSSGFGLRSEPGFANGQHDQQDEHNTGLVNMCFEYHHCSTEMVEGVKL